MFSHRQATAYCCESLQLIDGYDKAVSSSEEYCIHHRFEDMGLSYKDLIELGMYYKRPACELIFLTRSDHSTKHGLTRSANIDFVKKSSQWSKSAWATPEFRRKQKEGLNKVINTKEYRKNLSDGVKRALSTPQARAKRSTLVKEQWKNNPDRRKKAREITTKLWNTSEYRIKVISRCMEAINTPEYKQKMTEFNRKKAQNPLFLMKLKLAREKLSKEYKDYKNNGGELTWNKWRSFHTATK